MVINEIMYPKIANKIFEKVGFLQLSVAIEGRGGRV